jgi:hypothetical protein
LYVFQAKLGYPGKKVKKDLAEKKPDRQLPVSLKRSDLAVHLIAKLHIFEGLYLKIRENKRVVCKTFIFRVLLYKNKETQQGNKHNINAHFNQFTNTNHGW